MLRTNNRKGMTVPKPYGSWEDYYAELAVETGTAAENPTPSPATETEPNAGDSGAFDAYAAEMTSGGTEVAPTPAAAPTATAPTELTPTTTPASVPPVRTTTTPRNLVNTTTPSPTTGANFSEWYRNNYGTDYTGGSFTRKEGMSATDYAIGLNMYYAEKAQEQQQTEYDNSLKEIAATHSGNDQEAYILFEKMKKYLTMANQSAGTAGLSSGDLIQSGQMYRENLASNEEQAQGAQQAATSAFQTGKLDAQRQSQEQLYGLYASQDAEQDEDDDQAAAWAREDEQIAASWAREDELIAQGYAREDAQIAAQEEYEQTLWDRAVAREDYLIAQGYTQEQAAAQAEYERTQGLMAYEWAHEDHLRQEEIDREAEQQGEDEQAYRGQLVVADIQSIFDEFMEENTTASGGVFGDKTLLDEDGNVILTSQQKARLTAYYQQEYARIDNYARYDLYYLLKDYIPGLRNPMND